MNDLIAMEVKFLNSSNPLKKSIENYLDFSNIFWFYYQFESTISIDRFGYSNKYLPFRGFTGTLRDFPKYSEVSFRDCVFSRVSYYSEKAKKENKKIVVSCSGGVDSVCVASSFIISGIPIILLYTETSLEEYPLFFELIKKENVEVKFINQKNIKLFYDYYARNHILIFGNGGDQLFGSTINLKYPEWFYNDYKDFVIHTGGNEKTLEQFSDIFSHYKLDIQKTSEFVWFLNFSIKFTKVCYAENLSLHNPYSFHAFFDTPSFDSWCVSSNFSNISKSLPTNPRYYRPEEKEIIYEFTKDIEYLENKSKTRPRNWLFASHDDKLISYLSSDGIHTLPIDEFKFSYFLDSSYTGKSV